MFDINVLLDVFQERAPYCDDSARCMSLVVAGVHEGFIAAHAITTLFYLLNKHTNATTTRGTIDWLLKAFRIAPVDHEVLAAALRSSQADFEDAVVAESAHRTECTYVLTRNVSDFETAATPALTPGEFLRARREAP